MTDPRDPALSRRAALQQMGAAAALPLLGGRSPVVGRADAGQARALRARDYVIEGAQALVTRDGTRALLPDASVRVRGNTIVAVQAGRIRGRVTRVDARGQLLLPGFISGHTHAASGTPTRGLIEGGRSYQRPIELLEALPDDLLDAITAHNVAELLRSGCTSHVEMSLSLRQAQSYVRVARRWGVRGFPGGDGAGGGTAVPHLAADE